MLMLTSSAMLVEDVIAQTKTPEGAAPASTTSTADSTTNVKNKTVEQKETTVTKKAKVEQQPTFNIYEFKVLGNTVLDNNKIEEAVYEFMGEQKTIDDVQKARTALEKTYHQAGYLTVSVSIPQQDVNDNLVQLQVLEGKVERLRVKDSNYHSLEVIKERVAEFSEGNVPHFPTVQKQLATVNRGQNRQVAPVLRPGKSPGKLEVDLKVKDKLPLHGSLELNDRFSPNTTRTRLNGSLRYENLWQKDHSLGVSFQVSPENTDEVQVVSGTYVIPTLSGDYFAAYGVISRSNISVVGDVNVLGDGTIAGFRYIHPLPQLENYYHTLTAGFDYKDFDETVSLSSDSGFDTPIAYSMFNLAYDGTFNTKQSQTKANVGINFGVRGLGNDEQEFENKRLLAKPNFATFRADINHLQNLPKNWKLQARLAGQVASGALVSPEQFTIGGADSVRGYPESNALGDKGAFASLELRTPSIHQFISDYFNEVYAYTFVDAGYVKTIDLDPNLEQSATSDLLSTGLGLKLKALKGLYANLDYAQALKDSAAIQDGDERVHFRLGYEW